MRCQTTDSSANCCNYPHDSDSNTDHYAADIPRPALLSTLRREEELRLCPELQELYDTYDLPPPEIEAELQRHALAENGFCRCWLHSYYQTSYRYPKDHPDSTDIRNTTVWLRHYERYMEDQEVPVSVSDRVPDVPLVMASSTGEAVSLLSFVRPGLPLVVIAGSGS